MTIRDIAELAGVSVSTVSKVINNKAQGINSETAQRVLAVVKQYNYSPYANVKVTSTSMSFLIGLIVKEIAAFPELVQAVINCAKERGYQVIVCEFGDDKQMEKTSVLQLCKNRVDAVIWQISDEDSEKNKEYFEQQEIPVIPLKDIETIYYQAGIYATDLLVNKGHTDIACVGRAKDEKTRQFFKGYRHALLENNIVCRDELFYEFNEKGIDESFFFHNVSGALSLYADLTARLMRECYERRLQIPEDLSIVAVCDRENEVKELPWVSSILIPYKDLGKTLCDEAIGKIEGKKQETQDFELQFRLDEGGSLDIPHKLIDKRVVVVGNINMDIIINVREWPQTGKTISAGRPVSVPGGKGANQAVGAARLGADVTLIGKVGCDFEGNSILQYLSANHVNIGYVERDREAETGKAYIHVCANSESSIAIYAGVNDRLRAQDIMLHKDCFSNCSYCLLQTEIPIEAVKAAAQLANQAGACTILKPALVNTLDEELLKNVDILVPNRTECALLSPDECETLEEQAEFFLEKGVKNVIVTLGNKGCYLKNESLSCYIDAEQFDAVDATGASDAFIAALAAYLIEKKDMLGAVRYATVAAGLSVTKSGAIPSMVDADTLQMYFSRINDGKESFVE